MKLIQDVALSLDQDFAAAMTIGMAARMARHIPNIDIMNPLLSG
jgi:hypothetical protein